MVAVSLKKKKAKSFSDSCDARTWERENRQIFTYAENIDIDDPWGYDIKIYSACAKEIVECVDKLLEKI